eukprot:747445-Hanusia_phi.AAC.4
MSWIQHRSLDAGRFAPELNLVFCKDLRAEEEEASGLSSAAMSYENALTCSEVGPSKEDKCFNTNPPSGVASLDDMVRRKELQLEAHAETKGKLA